MTTADNAAKTTSQPQAAMKMGSFAVVWMVKDDANHFVDVLPSSAGPSSNQSQQCEHKAQRIRGGGAGKVSLLAVSHLSKLCTIVDSILQDCLLGCIGCFLCFGELG